MQIQQLLCSSDNSNSSSSTCINTTNANCPRVRVFVDNNELLQQFSALKLPIDAFTKVIACVFEQLIGALRSLHVARTRSIRGALAWCNSSA
jgi:hypothetical protein